MELKIYQLSVTTHTLTLDVGELQCSNKKHVEDEILISTSSNGTVNEVPPASRIKFNSLVLRNGRNIKAEYIHR